MNRFKTLDELRPDDRALVGGKAFNCGLLRQAGLPVPDGIAISCHATDADVRGLVASSWVRSLPEEARLAVRSSGLDEDSEGHSFAGMHETRLNVDRGQLVDAVLACRQSADSAQARVYREARALGDAEPRIGILIQCMVPAVLSGVAFTVNPITAADEIVVNVAAGLGEDLVSGRVDPDEFRLEKRTGSVLSATRGAAGATLSDGQLAELAALLTRVESVYRSAQDVEWCHDGARFWLVQSRPVTTLAAAGVAGGALDDRNPETEWTRANLVEVLPDMLAPQVLASYDETLNRGQRMFMGRLLAPDADLGPMFKPFRGRLYMNLSQMRRVVAIIRAPAAGLLRSLGHPEAIRPEDEVASAAPLRETLRCLPDLLRIASYDVRAAALFREHERRCRELVGRLSRLAPAAMSDRELWNTIVNWGDSVPAAMQIVFVLSGTWPRETALKNASATAGIPYERLVYPHLAAGQRSVSSQQAFDLVELAVLARQDHDVAGYLRAADRTFSDFRRSLAGTGFLESFDRFLDEYGHRGRYESDWSLPRLHEQPAPALFAIRELLDAPPPDPDAALRREAEAAAAWRDFYARLTWWQKLTLAPRVRSTLGQLKTQYVRREQVRSDLTRVLRQVRPLHLALADRFVERGWISARDDYFLLTFAEIQPAIDDARAGPELRATVRLRQSEVAAARALKMPLLMKGRELSAWLRRPVDAVTADAQADELHGLCVSPGLVEGEVVVLHDPSEFASMKRGAILVAPATDPSWTPLFTLASGVIVEVGGMLSHASTIAREFGLPALANVKGATTLLKTGDRVTLDASGGRVRLTVCQENSQLEILERAGLG